MIPQERGLRSQRRELAVEWRYIVGGSIFLGFQREQRRGLFAELELEFADRLAFPAYLSGLAGGLAFNRSIFSSSRLTNMANSARS